MSNEKTNRVIVTNKDNTVTFPSEIERYFDNILSTVDSLTTNNGTIFKLGDISIPTGNLIISQTRKPYDYLVNKEVFKVGKYPLFLNYDINQKHLGYQQFYFIKFQKNKKVNYWKFSDYRKGKLPILGNCKPNLVSFESINEINVTHNSILLADLKSLAFLQQQELKKAKSKEIKTIKSIDKKMEVKSNLISLDKDHNLGILSPRLGSGIYFSYLGYDAKNTPVCMIIDMHIKYFLNVPC